MTKSRYNLFTRGMERSSVQTVLTGLFVASGLLHFYYDGFIWRIRESKTRSALGVTSDSESEGPAGALLWSADSMNDRAVLTEEGAAPDSPPPGPRPLHAAASTGSATTEGNAVSRRQARQP